MNPTELLESLKELSKTASLTPEGAKRMDQLVSLAVKERLAGMPKTAGWDEFSVSLVEQGLNLMAPAILISGSVMAVWAFEFIRQMLFDERVKSQKSQEAERDQKFYDPNWLYTEQPTDGVQGSSYQ